MNDEHYIKLCIDLAKKGIGNVSPNPLVGCVIVKDKKIIGSGYHQEYGKNHAEVNAINSAKDSLLNSTLYVNLEPCAHYGNTPPCVNKIIESGIKKVVIGTIDPNPLVAGKGIKALRTAGIEVKVGLLKNECYQLNKFFFKYIRTGLPYVNLKVAQTLDGFIADKNYNSKWISSVASRKLVHSMRAEYDAVLIGVNTANVDNPDLNVRLIKGRNPFRIILDTNLSIKRNLKLVSNNSDKKTIIICSNQAFKQKNSNVKFLESKGVKVLSVKKNKNGLDLMDVLGKMGQIKITSVLVEGGSKVFSSFLKKNIWDEINLFIAPKILGDGISPFSDLKLKSIDSAIEFNNVKLDKIENDIHITITKN